MAINPKFLHNERDFRNAFTVTKSDTVNLASDPLNPVGYPAANALLVLTAGTVTFATPSQVATGDGATPPVAIVPIVTGSVAAGTIIPIDTMRVYSTGTTATIAALIR